MSTNFKREFVLELHKKGKNTRQILDKRKSLNLNKMFVKRTVDHYNEINLIKNRKRASRLRSIRRLSLIKSAREKIRRNANTFKNTFKCNPCFNKCFSKTIVTSYR